MTYTELAASLNDILEKRRKISAGRSYLIPARGHEEEHRRLTEQAEEIRKKMRRARYGTKE
jgi:hypothetical protein